MYDIIIRYGRSLDNFIDQPYVLLALVTGKLLQNTVDVITSVDRYY